MVKMLTLCFLLSMGNAIGAELITTKESKLPDASANLATRGISRGPGIKLLSPASGQASVTPFEFKVEFVPRGGAGIDPSTVKVVYVKNPMVDLTGRLKSSITADGIDFKDAKAPVGDHQLKVVVKDTDGREGVSFVTLSIVQ